MKTKKAVGGRLGMLGSLTFFTFPTLALLALGSFDLGFFLQDFTKHKPNQKPYKTDVNISHKQV
jgi:hypothetical protein